MTGQLDGTVLSVRARRPLRIGWPRIAIKSATGGCGHCLSSPLRAPAPLSGRPQGAPFRCRRPSATGGCGHCSTPGSHVPRAPALPSGWPRLVSSSSLAAVVCEASCTSPRWGRRSVVVRLRQEAVATVNPGSYVPLAPAPPGGWPWTSPRRPSPPSFARPPALLLPGPRAGRRTLTTGGLEAAAHSSSPSVHDRRLWPLVLVVSVLVGSPSSIRRSSMCSTGEWRLGLVCGQYNRDLTLD